MLGYTEKVSGTLSKIMEIYAVNEDKGYIMTYLAFTDITRNIYRLHRKWLAHWMLQPRTIVDSIYD